MPVLLALTLCLVQEEPAPVAPPAPDANSDWLDSFHGTVRSVYRSRWTGDASDSDWLNFLSLRAGNAEKDLISVSASGRFQSDFDGDRNTRGSFEFDSISDSYRRALTGQLYTAYADITNPWPGVRARAGRQILDSMPEALPMDGGLVAADFGKDVSATIFGGLPVNYFESSPSGDWMYGAWLEARPWDCGRARLEYLHLEDENTFGLFRDDLIGVTLEHREEPWLIFSRTTVLESEARDILVRASAADPESGFTLDLRGYYLFEQQQAHSYGFDAFVVFLLPVEPYYQFSVNASKELTDHFGIDVALTVRALEDSGDEGDYNHEFSRWSFTLRSAKWPAEELSLFATGDFWHTDADEFWTAGGGVSWQASETVRVDASSTYSLYSIDLLSGEERERVRTLSLALRWKVSTSLNADVRFIAEENDLGGFRTLDIGARYAF